MFLHYGVQTTKDVQFTAHLKAQVSLFMKEGYLCSYSIFTFYDQSLTLLRWSL